MKIVVIGGGISGLATAYAIKKEAQKAKKKIELTILEADDRVGGKIKTDRVKGYICEYGPNGFLSNRPETLSLIRELDINSKLLESNPAAKKRYIFSNKKLHKIPDSPPAFVKSFFSPGLLSLKGKLSVLKEPFAKLRKENTDETMLEFAVRHIGKEAAEKLIDSMAAGIFGGRADRLSIGACLPVMVGLEKLGNGSLVRAMLKRMKQAKKNKEMSRKTKASLMSFNGGMEILTRSLSPHLDEDIQQNNKVISIDKQNNTFKVFTSGGKEIEADIVVLAVPAYAAAEITKSLENKMSQAMEQIPYAPMAVATFGYPKNKIQHKLDGFGFLVPSIEKRKILGTLWTSSIFNNQAPKSRVSLRTMIGGARNPELTRKEDAEIIKLVISELKIIMDIDTEPEFINLIRHEKAIPQYTLGHLDRLVTIGSSLKKIKGLFVTGNAYRGVGVNDCVVNSLEITKRVVELF